MPAFKKQITAYQLQFASNSFRPRIWLKDAVGFIGQCIFHPNGSTLPADNQTADGQANLNYHLEEFPMIMDILRNEKPVYMNYNGTGPGNENAIQTGLELPGEGE
jgi:hypothetical protein